MERKTTDILKPKQQEKQIYHQHPQREESMRIPTTATWNGNKIPITPVKDEVDDRMIGESDFHYFTK